MVEATPESIALSTSSLPPASVLQQLRAATAVQHKTLEARLPLTSPDLDRSTYARIIKAYYGFHVPLQHSIERFLDAAPDPARHKIPALIKDLHALGLTREQVDGLPLCTELPVIDSEARLLGVMYVMEGATLGGQVLRRIIADRLGIDADTGGEFLDVYGRETGRLWKAFLARLAEFDDPEQTPRLVDAACETFTRFEHWLDHAGVLK
ncbi:biliverdin-producing heme oxygenase [Pseudomonas sp. NPDC088368]|uniref:biliverdin-producing heme oxygenase n=1 Tax=Pseudomonas sp. NPDC088368 TaxID=3364453 RepID=UPI00380D94AC